VYICRQALYDERTQLISQLFQRLATGHAGSDVDAEAGSDEDGLAQIMSIRKGLLLIVRLMPLLSQVHTYTYVCLIIVSLSNVSFSTNVSIAFEQRSRVNRFRNHNFLYDVKLYLV